MKLVWMLKLIFYNKDSRFRKSLRKKLNSQNKHEKLKKTKRWINVINIIKLKINSKAFNRVLVLKIACIWVWFLTSNLMSTEWKFDSVT